MINEMKPTILVRLIGETAREWKFNTAQTLLRFGASGVEISDASFGSSKAQITFYEGYWWVQSAPGTILKVSENGRASGLIQVEGSGLLKVDQPNIISLNDIVLRIEFTDELSVATSTPAPPKVQLSESNTAKDEGAGQQSVKALKVVLKKAGTTESQTFEYSQENIIIGRDSQAEIKLEGRLVSRQHAELKWNGEYYDLIDLGSALGVQVNGSPLKGPLRIDREYSVDIGPYNITLSTAQEERLQLDKPQQSQAELITNDSSKQVAFVAETVAVPDTASANQLQSQPQQANPHPQAQKSSIPQASSAAHVVAVPKLVMGQQDHSPNRKDNRNEQSSSPDGLDQQKTKVKYRKVESSRRNVDLKWREPLDVFKWSGLRLGAGAGALIACIWVLYWFAAGETLKVGSLSSAHSGTAYQELNNQMSHMRSNECNACHAYEIPKINQAACLSCHKDLESKSIFHTQHKLSANTDNRLQDCAQCHIEHQSNMVSLVDEGKCIQCHPSAVESNLTSKTSTPASRFIEIRHDQLNKEISLPKQLSKQVTAVSVGLGISKNNPLIHTIHGNINGQCVGCHANADRSGPVDPKQQCGRCHSNQAFNDLAETSTLPADHGPFDGRCLSCHTVSERLSTLILAGTQKEPNVDNLKQTLLSLGLNKPQDDQKAKKVIQSSEKNNTQQDRGMITGFAAGLSIFALLLGIASRNRLRSKREEGLSDLNVHESMLEATERAKKLINIFDDACVGCGECVTACPYDVLALLKNKDQKTVAKVVNFESCNECNDCVVVCKPQALTRRNEGEPLPMIEAAILDAQYMTNIHGLYLIGEASGTSLVRNANNLGSKVAQHIAHRGEGGNQAGGVYDVVIIGAGPAGVSAAITAKQKGLSYLLFEQGEERLNILATQYPKGKQIQNQPAHVSNIGPLPMDDWDVLTKEEFLKRCEVIMNREGLEVQLNTKVTGLKLINEIVDGQQIGQARFEIHTQTAVIKARNAVLAVGARGAPRQLGCTGEDHEMIQYHLTDPEALAGQNVVVVGGGNSALEAAISIGEVNAGKGLTTPLVTLVYRGEVFKKASDRNQRLIKEAEAQGQVKLELSMNPAEVGDGFMQLKPSKGSEKAEARIQAEVILCMIGSLPPSAWMKKIGVEYTDRPQGWSPSASDDLTFLDL